MIVAIGFITAKRKQPANSNGFIAAPLAMTKFSSYLFITVNLFALSGCSEKQNPESAVVAQVKVVSAEKLIDQHHCLSCHLPGNAMDLPSWRDVAEKYIGDKKAENFLVNKISQGGSGSWGNMDMPPYFELSEPERRIIAQWILAYDTTKPASKNSVLRKK